MDILGFALNIKKDYFKEKYQQLINKINTITDDCVTIYLLSDSIVLLSSDCKLTIRYTRDIYTWGILNDFWIRGAIAAGEIEPNINTEMKSSDTRIILPYLGDIYLRAYNMESQLNLSGIALDDVLVSAPENCDLKEDTDFIIYQEYLPKEDRKEDKKLLLPNDKRQFGTLINNMYIEQMLQSHVNDIDKYVNTFSYFIFLFMRYDDISDVDSFLDDLCKQIGLQGRRLLIPNKIFIIFIALIKGLFDRYRSPSNKYYSKETLEYHISKVIEKIKQSGNLSVFTDYIIEYDKKRSTTLYQDIYMVRADISYFK